MRRKFRLIKSSDSVFDDLDALRLEQGAALLPTKRGRSTETFARIPHDRALALARHKLGNAAWLVLIELDRKIFEERGRNPVRLSNHRLKLAGLTRPVKTRALRQLEAAGVITILDTGGGGRSPLVLHNWFPRQD
jgi:hypothetical protein